MDISSSSMRSTLSFATQGTLVVAGVSHASAPIGILERLSIPDERLPKALFELEEREHVREAVILSTCNRTEIYALAPTFHGGARDLDGFLSDFCHVEPEEMGDYLYLHSQASAIRHLFRVTAGLESMLLGEPEILGQVRRAFRVATEEGAAGAVLGEAFRRALTVGKRVRTETDIARQPVSVPSAAVELVKRGVGDPTLAGKRVAIVGAGAMARLTAQVLQKVSADLLIVNRSEGRGHELARRYGARFSPLSLMRDALAATDVVICATNCPEAIIDRPLLERVVQLRRSGDPLIVVDIALPRDVDPACGQIPGVALHDLSDLRSVVDANLGRRLSQVPQAEAIVAHEVARFGEWRWATHVAPTLTALVAKADAIRVEELARLRARAPDIAPDQWAAVEQLAKRIVAKMLHTPLTGMKNLRTTEREMHLAALRELFDLDGATGEQGW
jgi:glutamyl-tRNA reductase